MKVHQEGATVTLMKARGGGRIAYCESCMVRLNLAMKNVDAVLKVAENHLDEEHPAKPLGTLLAP